MDTHATKSLTRKMFISQLNISKGIATGKSIQYEFQGVRFSRAWIQGLIIELDEERNQVVVDDGSGMVSVNTTSFRRGMPSSVLPLQKGDYIMIIGPVIEDISRCIHAHQIISLNTKYQREAIWILEVIEYWKSVRVVDGLNSYDTNTK